MGFLLAALLGGFLVFNTQATPDKAARVMEKVLSQRFPGAQVKADIEGKRGRNVLKGRFERVRIEMARFRVAALPASNGASSGATSSAANGAGTLPALQAVPRASSEGRIQQLSLALRDFDYDRMRVAAMDVELQEVTFDWKALQKRSEIKIVRCGAGRGRLELPVSSLEVLLKERLPDMQELRLSIDGDLVRVSGKRPAPVIGVLVPFALAAKLEARGNEVWLAQPSLQMGGLPVASMLTNAYLNRMNPIYVFDRERQLPFRVAITNMQARDGALELSGNLQFVPSSKS